jgi:tetratricopeptide (TPR) repeat protein
MLEGTMQAHSGKVLIGGLAAFWFLVAGAVSTPADQKDMRLPQLFDALKAAPSPEDAELVEGKIWAIWLEAHDPAIDTLMAEGSEAMRAQQFGTAMEKFNAIIAQRPDFAEGWNKRATLFYMMGDYTHSLADIDHTLELEPRHIGALSGLGLVNLQMDREEAAADAFERVLAIDPQSTSAKKNLTTVRDILKRKQI